MLTRTGSAQYVAYLYSTFQSLTKYSGLKACPLRTHAYVSRLYPIVKEGAAMSPTDQPKSSKHNPGTERARADVRARVIDLLRATDAADARRGPAPGEVRAARTARADARSLGLDALRSLGVDTARADAVARARNAQLAAAAEADAKASEAEAEAAGARLAESAAVDLKGWHAVTGGAVPFVPQSVIVGTPLLIWASPRSNILWDSHLQEGDNWALAKLAISAEEYNAVDIVRWIFMWANPVDAYAVVNVASLLYLNGFIRADADGSGPGSWIDIGNGSANLSASVSLAQWKYWTEQPAPGDLSWEGAGSVSAQGGFYDAWDTLTVSGYRRANAEMLIIPPLATELFEVRLKLSHSQVDGSVAADFAEFGRRASCPYLVVQVLSNQSVGSNII